MERLRWQVCLRNIKLTEDHLFVSVGQRCFIMHCFNIMLLVFLSLQSGCCKPPTCCNFVYLGGTTWVATTQGSICTKDVDCRTWSNDAAKLCYNCLSCKAAVLATAEREIKTGVIFSIVFLFYIIFAYSIAARRLSHTLREM